MTVIPEVKLLPERSKPTFYDKIPLSQLRFLPGTLFLSRSINPFLTATVMDCYFYGQEGVKYYEQAQSTLCS